MDLPMEDGKGKGKGTEESKESPIDPQELVSDDDEIDYSIKPEFYDPLCDEKDETWVHKKRKGRISDAVLSCPACFSTLCLDCQRHEKYVTQFRAMFVFNCKIKSDQILRQRNRKVKRPSSSMGSDEPRGDEKDALFRLVCCSVCSTEVGVFDEDEVKIDRYLLQHAFGMLKGNCSTDGIPFPTFSSDRIISSSCT